MHLVPSDADLIRKRNKKKIAVSGEYGGSVQHGDLVLFQKCLHTKGIIYQHIVMVENPVDG